MKYSSTLGWIPLITRCFTWSVHYGFVSLQYLFACTHRAVSAAAKQTVWETNRNLEDFIQFVPSLWDQDVAQRCWSGGSSVEQGVQVCVLLTKEDLTSNILLSCGNTENMLGDAGKCGRKTQWDCWMEIKRFRCRTLYSFKKSSDGKEEGGILFQCKHQMFLPYEQPSPCSTIYGLRNHRSCSAHCGKV